MSRLKALRKAPGYTQIKMQMPADAEQSDYSKPERSTRSMTFEQRRRLAQALHTGMAYLAGLADDPRPCPPAK